MARQAAGCSVNLDLRHRAAAKKPVGGRSHGTRRRRSGRCAAPVVIVILVAALIMMVVIVSTADPASVIPVNPVVITGEHHVHAGTAGLAARRRWANVGW